eukprot:m.514738 g.514738  ORF g.514738 m.514738 type:complete len:92 (+) comp21913_c0_seq5:396-671(+)
MEVEEASTPPVSTSVTSEVCDAIVIDDSADDDDASDAVVHTVGPIRLTSHDMALLRPRQWLNDQVYIRTRLLCTAVPPYLLPLTDPTVGCV